MADVASLPARDVAAARDPGVGYLMVMSAAALFAVNGTIGKIVLSSGLPSLRLTEIRCTGAFIGLAAVVVAAQPRSLQARRQELALLAAYGVVGVALVQVFYFLAIHRLAIGVSLLIQYLGPLLVALWARFVARERVRRRVWLALTLALVGLSLMVELWSGGPIDGLGVAFSLSSAVAFAASLLLAEHAVGRRDPLSLLVYGFLFATVFWAIVQPWWTYPFGRLTATTSLAGNLASLSAPVWALVAWIVVLGTIVPFFLVVGALRHLPATRVGIVAMLEPLLGTVVAWAWLDEALAAQQIAGGVIVLAAIFLAQTSR